MAELHAGDFGAVAKLKETTTGETLGDKNAPIFYPAARIPEPSITFAIEPKTRADEDRIGAGHSQDSRGGPGAAVFPRSADQGIFAGGLGAAAHRSGGGQAAQALQVELTLNPPKVPYRETIRGKADAEGKHKKQTGGHGQFGVCRVQAWSRCRAGAGFEFVDDVFGGAIPKNWIPSVEKGIRDVGRARSIWRDFRWWISALSLYDGKYHDVDSSRHGVQDCRLAGVQGVHEAGRPTLLEPVMHVEVYAPDQYSGDLMGNLSSRRGRISGSESRGDERGDQGAGAVRGDAQLCHRADVHDAGARRAIRWSFRTTISCPREMAEKVIAAHKPHHVGEEEHEAAAHHHA